MKTKWTTHHQVLPKAWLPRLANEGLTTNVINRILAAHLGEDPPAPVKVGRPRKFSDAERLERKRKRAREYMRRKRQKG